MEKWREKRDFGAHVNCWSLVVVVGFAMIGAKIRWLCDVVHRVNCVLLFNNTENNNLLLVMICLSALWLCFAIFLFVAEKIKGAFREFAKHKPKSFRLQFRRVEG